MPQAVSIFPAPPPPSSFPSSNQSGADASPSRFNDVLNDVQQKDSADAAGPSAQPNTAPDQSAKAANDKTGKSPHGKSADAKDGAKGKSSPAETKPEAKDDDAALVPPVPPPAPGEGDGKGKGKSKNPAHAAHDRTAGADGKSAAQPPVFAVKNPNVPSSKVSAPVEQDQAQTQIAAAQTIDADGKQADADSAAETEASSAKRASAAVKPAPQTPDSAGDEQASVGVQPNAANAANGVLPAGNSDLSAAPASDDAEATTAPLPAPADAKAPAPPQGETRGFAAVLDFAQNPAPVPSSGSAPAHAPASPVRATPDAQFADANHPAIVTGVHTTLLPNGGAMRIHLDPPDLGAMDISVQMRNGTMTATFDTSNDQASRMLSHSLGQLKTALEAQGVTVGGLHVQQTPRNSEAGNNSRQDDGQKQGNANDASAQQQEQQRKEMLRRMWKKLSGEQDPLDLVA